MHFSSQILTTNSASAAKAAIVADLYGTAEAVPFQSLFSPMQANSACMGHPALKQSETKFLCHQFLYAASDDERLRHGTHGREAEAFAAIGDGAGGEVDRNLVAGDDRLFFGGDLGGEQLLGAVDEFGTFDAEESVVECVAQIRLRETACDDQRQTFRLKRGDGLFAAGAGAEV